MDKEAECQDKYPTSSQSHISSREASDGTWSRQNDIADEEAAVSNLGIKRTLTHLWIAPALAVIAASAASASAPSCSSLAAPGA